MPAVQIVSTAESHTVTADGYQVHARAGEPGVVIADPAGRAWSRLSLLASLDRVDCADESYDLGPLRVTATEDFVEFELAAASAAWQHKTVVLRCHADRVELTARVSGAGTLGTVRLCGGRAVLPSGACGTFRSSIDFAAVFDPTPTEPIQVVRPASAAAVLGVLGDASPGRLHAVFCPPPLCLVLSRQPAAGPTDVPASDWLSLGVVAGIDALQFVELRYAPEDGGFLVELDYDGHTDVDGGFETPPLVLRPAADPVAALAAYREDLVTRGHAPAGPAAPAAAWWAEPIFCGWGAQCARATHRIESGDGPVRAADLARQDVYDEWLAHLAAHDVVPGTVVVDDRWQAAYGSAEPDETRWPDLRAWIAARHGLGQRVLLWWKAWDPGGLPLDECILSPSGRPVAVDPASPAYQAHLRHIVAALLGPGGLDADGFKVDFTQRVPAGRSLSRPGATANPPWGIALLYQLLHTLYGAAKAAKPDALVITHAPHPAFGDVTDMLRLNDILVHAADGAVVPAVEQLVFRHAVAAAALPRHLIDTDQWPITTRAQWRDYVERQALLGVPSLYYAEYLHSTEQLPFGMQVDHVGDRLGPDDLALVAETWQRYRAGQRLRR